MAPLRITAIQFRQKKIRICLFSMPANQLRKLVSPKEKLSTHPEGIQRILDPKRVKKIAEYISMPETILPNNIIVDFNDEVIVESTSTPGLVHVVFPDDEGAFGHILDGQHRLYGATHADSSQQSIELAVTALLLDDPKAAGRIFADINSTQKPVSKVLLVALQKELGALPKAEDTAAAVLESLNEDNDSPLKGRIKMFQDEKNKWITNDQAVKYLIPLFRDSGSLYHFKVDTSTTLLKLYFNAIKSVFPRAWGNNKDFRLTRSAGIEIMLGLFDRVRERAQSINPSPTISDFAVAMEPISDTDWSAETFKLHSYTNAGGRTRLRGELLAKLPTPGIGAAS